ncbi:hypothetical protein [Rhodococcoides kyotonense]|uniref:hypothetical protein n=1 Tax=Rhodococcoides kyotonense TaxID=398843 RepID=UPI0012ECECE0|nr:hypothetical protein [Rhodococcus kyotonensis]
MQAYPPDEDGASGSRTSLADNPEMLCVPVDLGRAAPGAAFDTGQGYDVVDRIVTEPPLAAGGRCAPA